MRIGVNFGVLLSSELEWQGMLNMVDGLLRPLITGLGVYSFIGDDFHADNSLHVWSWRLSLALASFLADPALLSIRDASPTLIRCYFLTVNTFLIHLVNLKLHALGFKNTAKCSHILLMLLLAAGVAIMQPVALVMCTAAATVQSVFLSVAAYSSAASSGETYRSLRFTAFLYVATGVVLLGLVVLDVQGELDGHHGHVHGHVYLLTPYALLQTVTVLALSGISSSLMQRLQYLFDKLLETCRRGLGNCRKGLVRGLGGEVRESDFAITGKRITVLGHTNNASRHCICSFPGKYGDLWDNAASSTSFNRYACSLACVFLTDQDSGLGRHAEKPDLPGGCWCHTIYGPLTPDAYLSEVEETSSSHDEIAFKRADAEAMGQIFLLKTLMDERDEQAWSQKKAEAKCQAEERCRENDEKAPWGCLWLQVWMRNIDIAKVSRLALYALILQTKPPRSGKAEFYLLPYKYYLLGRILRYLILEENPAIVPAIYRGIPTPLPGRSPEPLNMQRSPASTTEGNNCIGLERTR